MIGVLIGADILKISEGMPQYATLAIEQGFGLRRAIAQHSIAAAKIAVHDGGIVVIEKVLGTPAYQLGHRADHSGFRRLILPAPTRAQTGQIPLTLHRIQRDQCPDITVIRATAFRQESGLAGRNREIPAFRAFPSR